MDQLSSHELARRLLEQPDAPVAYRVLLDHVPGVPEWTRTAEHPIFGAQVGEGDGRLILE